MKTYKVGDRAWWALYERISEVEVPCPVCYTKREVTLILGNGEQVILPCNYCGHSYEPPSGYVKEYREVAKPIRVTIGSVTVTESTDGEKREYRVSENLDLEPGPCWIPSIEDLFDTEDEAATRALERAEEARIVHETRAEYLKKRVEKTYAWNAGYHMREAKKERESAERHEKLARICKEKAS